MAVLKFGCTLFRVNDYEYVPLCKWTIFEFNCAMNCNSHNPSEVCHLNINLGLLL